MQQPANGPAEQPRWLDGTELEAWMALAELMVKLPAALDAQLQRDAELTMFEYFVLSALSMAQGRTMRMSALAAIVNGSLSRLSNVVKRLEQREWVRRERCPDNGRYTNVVLTEAGWDLVVASAPGHVAAVRHFIFDVLTAEQVAALTQIGRRIGQRVDPDPQWP
ncbi:MarR family winged helix-turn-helix transcriptional regulator [Nonomuraea sp. NPDC050790]|uniref:MarR family winged helix-turn-helix transcriptional regulator n=1 Tax=Nonomuraea sp. NPDC050790 TaxID=3364371 RepID=UPI0037B6FDAC